MQRLVLDSSKRAPGAEAVTAKFNRDVVEEVAKAVEGNEWVIVGMKQNPVVGKAKKLLDDEGIKYAYLEYGSYLSGAKVWRQRLAIKLWAGYPLYPMIFRKGTLLGGFSEISALHKDGKLRA